MARFKTHSTLVYLLVLSLVTGSGCWFFNEEDDGDGKTTPKGAAFTQAVSAFTSQGQAVTLSAIDTVRIQTQDFAYTTDTAPPLTDQQIAEFDAALLATLTKSAGLVGTGMNVYKSFKEVEEEIKSRSFSLGVGKKQSKLLFMVSMTVATVALAGYVAYQGFAKGLDQRMAPAQKALQLAQGAELEQMNQALGLPPDATNEEALAQFSSLGINPQTIAMKEIERINRDPDVGSYSASADVAGATAQASRTVGETGVTTYAGLLTTATGGQGYTQVAQRVGFAEEAAQVIDLTVSGVSAATNTPLQPLDLLAASMSTVSADQETKEVEIPQPTQSMSSEDAETVLEGVAKGTNLDTVNSEELANAANTLARAFAADNAEAVQAQTSGDSVKVQVSKQIHSQDVKNPKSGERIKVPKMGVSNVIVVMEGQAPQVIGNVDTGAASPEIEVEVDVETEQEPPQQDAGASGNCAGTPLQGSCIGPFFEEMMITCLGMTGSMSCTIDTQTSIDSEGKIAKICWSGGATMITEAAQDLAMRSTYYNSSGKKCGEALTTVTMDGDSDILFSNASGESLRMVISQKDNTQSVTCPDGTTETYDLAELQSSPQSADCAPIPNSGQCAPGDCP